MLYAIMARDAADAARLRAEHLQAHLAYAERIAGRLLVAGPLRDETGGFTGSLVVIEAADEADARAAFEADPYRAAGVWADVEIRRFTAAVGDWVGGRNW